MFQKLSIRNYILIDEVQVQFGTGLNVITGATGAGKSVLMGALALLSGQRAEGQVLKNPDEKCIVELEVKVDSSLKTFFETNDIEFEPISILRREIHPNGKSRSFVNDVPVNLKVMEDVAFKLFDWHSQHQNLKIKQSSYRLQLIDDFAGTHALLSNYKTLWEEYQNTIQSLKTLEQKNAVLSQETEFIQFQFDQLDKAKLQAGELEVLEQELETLNHAEEIKQALSGAIMLLSENENAIISQLSSIETQLQKLATYYPNAKIYLDRISQNLIDLKDLSPDIEQDAESIEYDAQRILWIDERLALLHDLLRKHQLDSVEALIEKRNQLDQQLQSLGNFEFELSELRKKKKMAEEQWFSASEQLSIQRQAIAKELSQSIESTIQQLGIPKAVFSIEHQTKEQADALGKDDFLFKFSANIGQKEDDLSKIASGGEQSRIMLAIKNVWSKKANLSSLVLDEIDTGVSGEIAHKMAVLMQAMAKHRQLIVITHLPQIAAKGDHHFKVEKQEQNNKSTITKVFALNKDERILEIAGLLSGENISPIAIENAKALML
ncbi:MAG: DNA repair protein RecN [Bacteroidales bacterium]|nr:DNA repair protein RecN [Bacteroidales bacterium]